MLNKYINYLIIICIGVTAVFISTPIGWAQDDATPTATPTATTDARPDAGAATATPVATLAIDIFQPTPTPAPLNLTQQIDLLNEVALQAAELPGGVEVFSYAAPDNGTRSISEQVELWHIAYPNNPLVDTLGSVYTANGVLATNYTFFAAEDCIGLAVYGLGTWIRLTTGTAAADALLDNDQLPDLYANLFGWEHVEPTEDAIPDEVLFAENTRLYRSLQDTPGCELESRRYIYEYADGNLWLAIMLDLPTTTPPADDLPLLAQLIAPIRMTLEQRVVDLQTPGAPTLTPQATLLPTRAVPTATPTESGQ